MSSWRAASRSWAHNTGRLSHRPGDDNHTEQGLISGTRGATSSASGRSVPGLWRRAPVADDMPPSSWSCRCSGNEKAFFRQGGGRRRCPRGAQPVGAGPNAGRRSHRPGDDKHTDQASSQVPDGQRAVLQAGVCRGSGGAHRSLTTCPLVAQVSERQQGGLLQAGGGNEQYFMQAYTARTGR